MVRFESLGLKKVFASVKTLRIYHFIESSKFYSIYSLNTRSKIITNLFQNYFSTFLYFPLRNSGREDPEFSSFMGQSEKGLSHSHETRWFLAQWFPIEKLFHHDRTDTTYVHSKLYALFVIITPRVERVLFLRRFLRTFYSSYLLREMTDEYQNIATRASFLRLGMAAAIMEPSEICVTWNVTPFPLNLHIFAQL